MAKKSFINNNNPAMQFISAAEQKTEAVPPEILQEENIPLSNEVKVITIQQDITDVYSIAPKSAEHKSKRAQLLMTPSLHNKVVKKAASLNMSFNEFVNLALEKYVR